MPTYTFTLEGRDLAHERVTTEEYGDDAKALIGASNLLGPDTLSVSVARGIGDEVEWLGAWDWSDGRNCWTPEE
jgi:hypothetical protein